MHLILFNLSDAYSVLLIAGYLLLASFASYLPMLAAGVKRPVALGLVIPMSFSIQILVAYILYTAQHTGAYPAVYAVGTLLANLWAVIILYRRGSLGVSRSTLVHVGVGCLFFIPVAYACMYDSVVRVSPAHTDALVHLFFLRNLKSLGYLLNNYYAPGFHLLLLPLAYAVPSYDILRFAGNIGGILSAGSLLLSVRPFVRQRLIAFLLPLILVSPLAAKLGLQMIAFFPSALTFSFLGAFVLIAISRNEMPFRQQVAAGAVLAAGVALTVPYFLVHFVVWCFVLTLLSLVVRKAFGSSLWKTAALLTVVGFLGLGVGFVHVYIQTKIVRDTGGFPSIPVAEYSNNGGGPTLAYQRDDSGGGDTKTDVAVPAEKGLAEKIEDRLLVFAEGTSFGRSMLVPIIQTGFDMARFKQVVPFNGLFNMATYFILLVSIVGIVISIRRRNAVLFVVSTLVMAYGFFTITGFFEMSYYRGRTGWYYLLSAVMFSVVIMDCFQLVRYRLAISLGVAALAITPLWKPLVFPRLYYSETYALAKTILADTSPAKLTIISRTANVREMDDRIEAREFSANEFASATGKVLLIVEKHYYDPRDVYRGIVFSLEKDVMLSQEEQFNQAKRQYAGIASGIESTPEVSGAHVYWENADLKAYLIDK